MELFDQDRLVNITVLKIRNFQFYEQKFVREIYHDSIKVKV